jgi:hypothetical protein
LNWCNPLAFDSAIGNQECLYGRNIESDSLTQSLGTEITTIDRVEAYLRMLLILSTLLALLVYKHNVLLVLQA